MATYKGTKAADSKTMGSTNDLLYGYAGNDTLDGGVGNDRIFGGNDNDTITGGNGADKLFGDKGNDTINAGAGNDQTDGGAGNDSIDGGADKDTLRGGNDNDTINGGTENDSLYGGNGNDSLSGGNDTDKLYGDAGDDILNGDAGKDTLEGGKGNDTLNGGSEDDVLSGGAGNDSISGGANTDTVSFATGVTAPTVANNGVTFDLADATTAVASGVAGADTVSSDVENITGSKYDDTLSGNLNANKIIGGSGADNLSGEAGADTLDGGYGADTLNGGAGGDKFIGGLGIDTVTYAGSTAVTVDLSNGTASGGDAAGDTFSGVESLIGSSNGDTLTAGLHGMVDGGLGADTIYDSDLSGGEETLYGGADNTVDVLDGTNGGGSDFFQLQNSATATDTLKGVDTASQNDKILIDLSIFSTSGIANGTTTLTALQLVTNSDENVDMGASGRFLFETDTGKIWYDANGGTDDVSRVAVAQIDLTTDNLTGGTMTVDDFILQD